MEFLFTFPIAMSATGGPLKLVAELEMKAILDFADPRDKEDYGITALYALDLKAGGKWFEVDPTTEGFSMAVSWLKRNDNERERLEREWEDYLIDERLVRKPLVHEHSTYFGRPS
jgi:hypothetical protein